LRFIISIGNNVFLTKTSIWHQNKPGLPGTMLYYEKVYLVLHQYKSGSKTSQNSEINYCFAKKKINKKQVHITQKSSIFTDSYGLFSLFKNKIFHYLFTFHSILIVKSYLRRLSRNFDYILTPFYTTSTQFRIIFWQPG
jgi:hypothetical protein